MDNIDTMIPEEMFEPLTAEENEAEAMVRPVVTYWQDAWRRLKLNKVAICGMVILIALSLMAVGGPEIVSYNYEDIDLSSANLSPNSQHWFGTDSVGRDLWARVWIGARISLTIALVAAVVQAVLGILIGGVAGYFGGVVDTVIMRVIDILYAIPFLIYIILIMLIIGSGIGPIIIAFALTGWIHMALLVRAQIMQIKEREFVKAAIGLGASPVRVIFGHLVPNISGTIIVTLTMRIPNAIFTEAYLSYIGIGLQPPMTSWGQLANQGGKVMQTYPYQLLIPAFFISITMLSLQVLGDGMRDALDPKLRR